MSQILITGGAGFIGANFIHYWQRQYPQDRVVALDALTYAGNRANLVGADAAGDFQFVHGDIRDQPLVEGLLRSHSIDTIVHFAAESHVDRSISGPDAFVDVNIVGTHSLLKAARSVWLSDSAVPHPEHRFHHVSTDEGLWLSGSTRTAIHRVHSLFTQLAVCSKQGGVGSPGSGLPAHLWSGHNHEQLF